MLLINHFVSCVHAALSMGCWRTHSHALDCFRTSLAGCLPRALAGIQPTACAASTSIQDARISGPSESPVYRLEFVFPSRRKWLAYCRVIMARLVFSEVNQAEIGACIDARPSIGRPGCVSALRIDRDLRVSFSNTGRRNPASGIRRLHRSTRRELFIFRFQVSPEIQLQRVADSRKRTGGREWLHPRLTQTAFEQRQEPELRRNPWPQIGAISTGSRAGARSSAAGCSRRTLHAGLASRAGARSTPTQSTSRW